jgi:hypothetical protein
MAFFSWRSGGGIQHVQLARSCNQQKYMPICFSADIDPFTRACGAAPGWTATKLNRPSLVEA